MNISSAIFDRSAPDLASCPDESLPEFAFIGRSNVGKSSLLNLLAGQENLARVSKLPGYTKMINHFTMNQCWRLVDLPGYGFAHVARKESAKFNLAVADYLQQRPNLRCVFELIDSGLPPQAIDLEFVQWLAANDIPFVFVFTKTDRVSATKVQANIAAFTERIAAWFTTLPEIYTCSARSGTGRRELLKVIEEEIAAAYAETGSSPGSPQKSPLLAQATGRKQKAGKNHRHVAKITRPW
ncbi:MAG: YihA family ribosome biogenesis GTP-binding protein [Verrucomicrobia bacterium]|nr:YihA family ribosome biogenesis GTP-binding protein [Verrucomicrobiota bacterium]